MSFDFDRKRTPEEIRKSLLACAETECEQCCFYEADAPRGYSGCHDWLLHTQAAEYIWELMVLRNCQPKPADDLGIASRKENDES